MNRPWEIWKTYRNYRIEDINVFVYIYMFITVVINLLLGLIVEAFQDMQHTFFSNTLI